MDKLTEKLIKRILWDYTISPESVYAVISGKKLKCAHWDINQIFVRMLERLSWYDLLHIYGVDGIKCYIPHNNSLCLIDKEVLNYYRQLLNKQGGKQ